MALSSILTPVLAGFGWLNPAQHLTQALI